MILNFAVSKLKIFAVADKCSAVVDDSINYVQCHFTFLDDFWQGKTVTAIFAEHNPFTDDKPTGYTVILDSDSACAVPAEVLKGRQFSVGLMTAYEESGVVKTVYSLPCTVPTVPSCYTDSIGTPGITPSQYDQLAAVLSGKVDKVAGKGLSEADYTAAEKEKLSSVETGAQPNVIEGIRVNNDGLVPEQKVVSFSVPQNTSDLTNDCGYVTSAAVAEDIAVETEARAQAVSGLQEQIDGLAASSDVVDVVGTYAALQAYDTTKIHDNDIVKVLSDSTHDDAITYYRWTISGGVGAWTYIGSQGPFYTKGEVDDIASGKADKVSEPTVGNFAALTATGGISDSGYAPSSFAPAPAQGTIYQSLTRQTNVAVAVADWISDNTFSDYPYRAAITLNGVTSSDYANVFFSAADIEANDLSPYTDTAADTVYIFASEIPSAAITIPLIEVVRV